MTTAEMAKGSNPRPTKRHGCECGQLGIIDYLEPKYIKLCRA